VQSFKEVILMRLRRALGLVVLGPLLLPLTVQAQWDGWEVVVGSQNFPAGSDGVYGPVTCPRGKIVIGGGFDFRTGDEEIWLRQNHPWYGSNTGESGWSASAYFREPSQENLGVDVFAICVNADQGGGTVLPPTPPTPSTETTIHLYDALDDSYTGFTATGGADLEALEDPGTVGAVTLSISATNRVSVQVDARLVVSATYNVFLHQANATEVLQTSNIGTLAAINGTGSGSFSHDRVSGTRYYWVSMVEVGGSERYRSSSAQ
jgi:hypothetical protein